MPSPKLDAAAALQQERTFKMKLEASKSYWSATYRVQLDGSGTKDAMEVSGSSPQRGIVQAIEQLRLPHLVPSKFKGRIVRDAAISCSAGKTECEFVLMPMGGMAAKRATQ